jgi:uncharacterized protein RhaS with RHS repeats
LLGNRLRNAVFDGSATTTSYAYNLANQITSDGAHTFTYNVNGNLTADGVTTYGYDAADRLVMPLCVRRKDDQHLPL